MILDKIQKSYNTEQVLKDVDLTIIEKEFLVILGNSGSGKSTLLKIIAGIEHADGGIIKQNEKEIQNIPIGKRDIGYIFQEPLLFPHMTVKQNVTYSLIMAKYKKNDIETKYKTYMQLLQIEELGEKMPNQLSGGQKQRVAIARAIINSPKILLMDEPFSSLDYNLRKQLGEMLLKLKAQLNLTIVFVTHDIEEAMLLGDRIAFLHKGKLLEINTPQKMYYHPTFEETAKFMGEYNIIYGEQKNDVFHTKYGNFKNFAFEKTAKKLFVRPNKINLIPMENGNFEIEKITYKGKEIRIKVKNETLLIDVYILNTLKIGDKVELKIEM